MPIAEDMVSLNRDGDVATLTLDRLDAVNALDASTLESMSEALEQVADEEAWALVLTGAEDDAFIASADIKYMKDLSVEEAHHWSELGHKIADALESFPVPTIASIIGYASGVARR